MASWLARWRTHKATSPDNSRVWAEQYALLLARIVFFENSSRYARVFEDISFTVDSCTRTVRLMWRLPLPGQLGLRKAERNSDFDLIVPIAIMRKGQMYSKFRVSSGSDVRILSRSTSSRLTYALISMEWRRLYASLYSVLAEEHRPGLARLSAACDQHMLRIANGTARDARRSTSALDADLSQFLAGIGASLCGRSKELHAHFVAFAQRVGRRHIIWGVLGSTDPGSVIEIEYSYETRFAAEHTALQGRLNWFQRAYETFRSSLGQPPYRVYIPISRHALARSYHVTLEAPAGLFLHVFNFADQAAAKDRSKSFEKQAATVGAQLGGLEESGGHLGHIYLHDMPQVEGLKPAVFAHLMERPPGSTGSVAWLATMTCLALALVLVNFGGIDEARITGAVGLALALPGIAAIWFGGILDANVRQRVPLATRLGLFSVSVSSVAMLVLIVGTSFGVSFTDRLWFWSFAIGIACPHFILTVCIWQQRAHFQRAFTRHQRRIAQKYGL